MAELGLNKEVKPEAMIIPKQNASEATLNPASISPMRGDKKKQKKPLKRFICNLNDIIGNTVTKPLTIISEDLDKKNQGLISELISEKQKLAKHCFITRDLENGTTQIMNEMKEYTKEELSSFVAIQDKIKTLSGKYNTSEEEIESLFAKSACNWEKVEETLKVSGKPTWTPTDNKMIKQLLESKTPTDVLARVTRLGFPQNS